MKNGSAGQPPHHEPAEAALMQEFASYLAQLSVSFAQPLSERLAGHEKDLTARLKKLADDIDRQRQTSVEHLAVQEASLFAKVKALADEVDRHRVRVAETQDTLIRGVATTVGPLSAIVRKTQTVVWACLVLSLVSCAMTLWLGFRR